MPATKQLSVRLPEPELRRIKGLAASRGLTLPQAVRQALKAWTSSLPPSQLDALQGSLRSIDVEKLMQHDRKAELVRDKQRSKGAFTSHISL